MITGAFFNC